MPVHPTHAPPTSRSIGSRARTRPPGLGTQLPSAPRITGSRLAATTSDVLPSPVGWLVVTRPECPVACPLGQRSTMSAASAEQIDEVDHGEHPEEDEHGAAEGGVPPPLRVIGAEEAP